MLVGIISDTHDNLPAIREAVKRLNREDVDLVLHAGDYISPFAVEELSELNCKLEGVFGNNDGEVEGLKEAVGNFGEIKEGPRTIEMDGEKVLVSHKPPQEVPEDTKLVVHGHTHKPKIEKKEKRRIINPGECSGWLHGNRTMALLDTEKCEVEIIEL